MRSDSQHKGFQLIASVVMGVALVAAMLAPVCATASPVAHAAAKVAFSGTYSGHASVTINGSSVTIASVSGTGTGTDGLSKLAGANGTGSTSGTCAFFSGPATLSGTGGKISLAVKSSSSGCGSGNQIAVKGSATVKGASGKLKKAKGPVTFTGTYNKATATSPSPSPDHSQPRHKRARRPPLLGDLQLLADRQQAAVDQRGKMELRTMKKLTTKTVALTLTLIAAVSALAVATGASASGTIERAGATTGATGVTQQPVQDWTAKSGVYFYVDTVTGGGSPKPNAPCAITNLFKAGQVVVFRMWGVNAKDGGATLTDQTVSSAVVHIPQPGGSFMKIPLSYAAHGTTAYWTGAWDTTASTPVGVVNFWVTVTTLPVKKTKKHAKVPALNGSFNQAGFPSVSQLTITPA